MLSRIFVCQEPISLGKTPYFWRSGNTAALDFLYEGKTSAVPLEVKGADNPKAKRYRTFCREYAPKVGFEILQNRIGESLCEGTKTITLPRYLVWNIEHDAS